MKWLAAGGYVLAIVAANVITANTVPAELGPFVVTWGTWLIGVTFILRDAVQVAFGRAFAYFTILVALGASLVTSVALGDTLAIVVGSAVAFLVSESTDTEVFTRLRARLGVRVAVSGVIGGLLDSCLFVIIALSPLWSGFITWEMVPNAILGQWIVKSILQVAAGAIIAVREPEPQPA